MQDLHATHRGVRAEKAFLASLILPKDATHPETALDEIRRLVRDAGATVVGGAVQRRVRPDPATLFGKGKAEQIGMMAKDAGADLVVADVDLGPAQARNLEKLIGLKVIDRTELILDIFASRARTQQARLQVELAQLEYALPRLRRMWTHLSRIEGGIGMRGPGEKQLESDRRAANRRIQDLKRRLAEIDARKRRQVESRRDAFKVSLVGYTNAGKSSLMNRLTHADVTVRDRLFETLDTRTRAWTLSGGRRVLLSDTVGFIRRIPPNLVASFHATLEETLWADLLLHVVDVSAPDARGQMEAVEKVLREIGAATLPVLVVFNKSDLPHDPIATEAIKTAHPENVTVSAETGDGLEGLEAKVWFHLEGDMVEIELQLAPGDGATEAAVARLGRVVDAEYGPDEIRLRALLRKADVDTVQRLAERGRGKGKG